MELNFSKQEEAGATNEDGATKSPWPNRDLWSTGDVVSFRVKSCDLMEVIKDEKTRIKVAFTWTIVDGPNAGTTLNKDVWDIMENKKSENFLKYMLGDGMGCPRDLLDGGNIPAALESVVGANFTATCEKTNGGKYTNWNDLTYTDPKKMHPAKKAPNNVGW